MENLYEPSLTSENIDRTRSYSINSLFYVAMFGGIFAIVVLGLQNAKWLKIEKRDMLLLTFISLLLIIAKLAIVYAIGQQIIDIDEKFIKLVGRLFGVACFFIFFMYLNKPYKEHLAVDGEAEPLLVLGIITCIVTGIIDATATVILLSL